MIWDGETFPALEIRMQDPHIDRLANEGIRFEQFYVNSPICSPSRVAISTGQYPQRWKISSYLGHRAQNAKRGMAQWLDPEAPMLARFLQNSGYTTGHFGKVAHGWATRCEAMLQQFPNMGLIKP